jgi:hypothetical protein
MSNLSWVQLCQIFGPRILINNLFLPSAVNKASTFRLLKTKTAMRDCCVLIVLVILLMEDLHLCAMPYKLLLQSTRRRLALSNKSSDS